GDGRTARLRHEDDRQRPPAREAQGALAPAVAPGAFLGPVRVGQLRAAVTAPEAVRGRVAVVDPEERGAVAAVVEPVLLLPARESRRAEGELIEHLPLDIVGHSDADVGDLGPEGL